MVPWTLTDIERALRASWAADTCSPDDLDRAGWSEQNPALGHCDITAVIVNDVFGGELVCGEVWAGAEQHGYHWWNRLASGVEVDLTREQFRDGQVITPVRVVARPPGRLPRRHREYELLRERVATHLGPLPSREGPPASAIPLLHVNTHPKPAPGSPSVVRDGDADSRPVTA